MDWTNEDTIARRIFKKIPSPDNTVEANPGNLDKCYKQVSADNRVYSIAGRGLSRVPHEQCKKLGDASRGEAARVSFWESREEALRLLTAMLKSANDQVSKADYWIGRAKLEWVPWRAFRRQREFNWRAAALKFQHFTNHVLDSIHKIRVSELKQKVNSWKDYCTEKLHEANTRDPGYLIQIPSPHFIWAEHDKVFSNALGQATKLLDLIRATNIGRAKAMFLR